MTSPYLSARQAAEYVGVTYRAFDQAVRREGIPCVRFGRHRRFKAEALDRFMQMCALRPRSRRRKVA